MGRSARAWEHFFGTFVLVVISHGAYDLCLGSFLDESLSLLSVLIFVGVGAMIDFRPLLAMPQMVLLGAAGQFGIYAVLLLATGIWFPWYFAWILVVSLCRWDRHYVAVSCTVAAIAILFTLRYLIVPSG